VVRQRVVPFGNSNLGKRAVAAIVGENQGSDPRRVGPEGKAHHVEHQPDVLPMARGMPRRFHGRVRALTQALAPLDPCLDLADPGEKLIQLAQIAGGKLA